MKRIFLFAILLIATLVSGMACAQTPVYIDVGEQVTFEWDAVTTLVGGEPIPPGDSILYDVWIDDGVTQYFDGDTTLLEYTTSFNSAGTYLVGIGTVRTHDSNTYFSYDPGNPDTLNWCDEDIPPGATPSPWQYVIVVSDNPNQPAGLRTR